MYCLNKFQLVAEWAHWKAKTGVFADPQMEFVWELVYNGQMDPAHFGTDILSTALVQDYKMLRPLATTSAANERYWSIR